MTGDFATMRMRAFQSNRVSMVSGLTSVSRLAIIVSAALSLAATEARAADQAAPDAQAPVSAAATVSPAPTAAPAPAEIIVTGSRISRSDYKAESPISTLGSAAIAAAASPSLDRALGEMPQFEAGQGAAEVGDVQGNVGFGGGASYSDLRGIGRNRSLVLMDGHRLMPSTPDGSIDLNTIPMSMIENMEVITGGASAAYGSDAVAGVANFKLRQHFNGVEMGVTGGISGQGDGATQDMYALAGGKFAEDKGHFMVDFEYSHRDAVLGSQRSFFTQPSVRFLARPPEGEIDAGSWGKSGAAPTTAAVNSVLAGYTGTTPMAGAGAYGGAIGVNTNGSLFTNQVPGGCSQNYQGAGTGIGVGISPLNCNAGIIIGNYFAVQVPLTKYNMFAKSDYEFSDHVTGYAQFNFSDSTALDETNPGFSKNLPGNPQNLNIPVSNPYVQGNAGLMTLLNSAYGGNVPGNTTLTYAKNMVGWGDRVENYHYDVWQGLGGLKGDIPGTTFTWDAYASYGRSLYNSTATGDISESRITNVLNNEGVGGCNWNPFGAQAVSSACLNYAGQTDNTSDTLSSTDLEFSTQGKLFTLPGGDAKIALGGDYRRQQYNYVPASAFVQQDTIAYGFDTPSNGEQDAKELFAETLLPLIKDKPFIQDFSLDLAYRYSKYNTFSGASTWKADASWTVNDALRLRGGYSRAIRAPSLADLYLGTSVANQAVGIDPCDTQSPYRTGANGAKVQALCAAQATAAGNFTNNGQVDTPPVQSGGNTLLQPEVASTWSMGGVLTPMRGLDISVDYYNIGINGAIAALGSNQILADCYGASANPTYSPSNPFCQRVMRNQSTGQIGSIVSGTFNFNEIQLDGIDTQIDYRVNLSHFGLAPTAGALQFSSIVSWLHNYTVSAGDGSASVNYAGGVSDTLVTSDGENLYSHPHWKGNTSLTYLKGPLNATLRWRYIGKMNNLDAPGSTVPAISYFDFDGHYTFNHSITFSGGINNLGNKAPPYIGTLELRTDAATYDVIGRTFYIGAKVKF